MSSLLKNETQDVSCKYLLHKLAISKNYWHDFCIDISHLIYEWCYKKGKRGVFLGNKTRERYGNDLSKAVLYVSISLVVSFAWCRHNWSCLELVCKVHFCGHAYMTGGSVTPNWEIPMCIFTTAQLRSPRQQLMSQRSMHNP